MVDQNTLESLQWATERSVACSVRAKAPPPCGLCHSATTMTLAKGSSCGNTYWAWLFWWKWASEKTKASHHGRQWRSLMEQGSGQIIRSPNQDDCELYIYGDKNLLFWDLQAAAHWQTHNQGHLSKALLQLGKDNHSNLHLCELGCSYYMLTNELAPPSPSLCLNLITSLVFKRELPSPANEFGTPVQNRVEHLD